MTKYRKMFQKCGCGSFGRF